MYRKIMGFLEAWKESEHRKPLILQGARQVGKTYSILEFGRTHYENVAYFNFETNPKLNETFEENISPDYLIPILSHIAGQTIVTEKTLIVFDEVQLCERALTSLKYFCENAPDYHIIVAGSLLGVAVNRAKFSFPVGKVDMKTLYPMDMEEFMLALGEDDLVEQIKKCFQTDTPLPSALHDAAMQLYRQYLVVGGMPECVMQFAETKDYILVRHTQDIEEAQDGANTYVLLTAEPTKAVIHAEAIAKTQTSSWGTVYQPSFYTNDNEDFEIEDIAGIQLLDDSLLIDDDGTDRQALLEQKAEDSDLLNELSDGKTYRYDFHYLDLVDANNGNAYLTLGEDDSQLWHHNLFAISRRCDNG